MKLRYACLAFCLVSIVACGDDDTTEPDDSDGGRGGRGGSTARAGANAGATAGVGGGTVTGLPDLTMLLTPMCNPDAESVTSCGGVDCPALPDGSESSCTITCCSADDRCGTRSSDTRIEGVLGTTCTAPAIPDTRCPDVSLGGFTAIGCCTDTNVCGQVVANICIPGFMPRACDAPPTPVEDAGI